MVVAALVREVSRDDEGRACKHGRGEKCKACCRILRLMQAAPEVWPCAHHQLCFGDATRGVALRLPVLMCVRPCGDVLGSCAPLRAVGVRTCARASVPHASLHVHVSALLQCVGRAHTLRMHFPCILSILADGPHASEAIAQCDNHRHDAYCTHTRGLCMCCHPSSAAAYVLHVAACMYGRQASIRTPQPAPVRMSALTSPPPLHPPPPTRTPAPPPLGAHLPGNHVL